MVKPEDEIENHQPTEENGEQSNEAEEEEEEFITIPPAEEDASTLKFSYEFTLEGHAQPLFISEVGHLLKVHVEKQEKRPGDLNVVLRKSLDYAERFGQLAKTEQSIAVRAQLEAVNPKLHEFEVAQLASLMPKEVDEAKAIIPSLAARYDDDVISDILKNFEVWL
ncbi:RNA polymerase Rpb4 [Gracilaria domingensis]|nr:RNA polymerase Rpb4 [Gracilaria domingensis]